MDTPIVRSYSNYSNDSLQLATGLTTGALCIHTFGKDTISPYFYVTYLNAKALYNLYLLESHENSLESVNTKNILSEAHAIVAENVKYSTKRMATNRVEAYGYMAKYLLLISKYSKAFEYYNKAIKEGERLGAKLELSRVYLELGKLLLNQEFKLKEFNGITAEEYVQKAKSMFGEMGLQWDIEQLDLYMADI